MIDQLVWLLSCFLVTFYLAQAGGGLCADKDKEEDFESSMGGGISLSAKTLGTQTCHGGASSFSSTFTISSAILKRHPCLDHAI